MLEKCPNFKTVNSCMLLKSALGSFKVSEMAEFDRLCATSSQFVIASNSIALYCTIF